MPLAPINVKNDDVWIIFIFPVSRRVVTQHLTGFHSDSKEYFFLFFSSDNKKKRGVGFRSLPYSTLLYLPYCMWETVWRNSVPHFPSNSWGIACWVAELNAALYLVVRVRKWKYWLLNFVKESNPQPVTFTVKNLFHCATTRENNIIS